MKPTNWKDVTELVGIAAIVASLVFVGWQMKQDRDIALAATYQERTAATVDLMLSLANNPAGLAAQITLDHGKALDEPIPPGLVDIPDGAPVITYHEFYAAFYEAGASWFLWDNSHYQYETGYLPEEHWERIRMMMRSALRKGSVSRYVFESAREGFRKSFRDEILTIIATVDAEPDTGEQR